MIKEAAIKSFTIIKDLTAVIQKAIYTTNLAKF